MAQKRTPIGGLQFQHSRLEDKICTGDIYSFHRLNYTPNIKEFLPLVEIDSNQEILLLSASEDRKDM